MVDEVTEATGAGSAETVEPAADPPKAKPAKRRKAKAKVKPEVKAKATVHVVADGKALTSLARRCVLGPGETVTADDVGGADHLAELEAAGYVKAV